MLCQQSSFEVEESRSSIVKYNIPLPIITFLRALAMWRMQQVHDVGMWLLGWVVWYAYSAHTGIFASDTRLPSRFLGGAWWRGYFYLASYQSLFPASRSSHQGTWVNQGWGFIVRPRGVTVRVIRTMLMCVDHHLATPRIQQCTPKISPSYCTSSSDLQIPSRTSTTQKKCHVRIVEPKQHCILATWRICSNYNKHRKCFLSHWASTLVHLSAFIS